MLTLPLLCWGQVIQKGVVKEYNEAKDKKPIAGVEIKVKNAASEVSHKDGSFELNFRTLKPGDPVEYSKIEKAGYEIFNIDALESWRIANDNTPFTIVLCKSNKFKALKEQYYREASKSYAIQQAKEEKRLAESLQQGKIQRAEYEKQLTNLRNFYEDQLDNLDTYIDRFARIDLSELSKEEVRIIQLVQDGKIDEAIHAYEDMKLTERYTHISQQITEINNGIEKLNHQLENYRETQRQTFDLTLRMIAVLELAGGMTNFESIKQILKSIVEADPAFYKAVSIYARFLTQQNDLTEAIYWTRQALSLTNDPENIIVHNQDMGLLFLTTRQLDSCEYYYNLSLNEIRELKQQNTSSASSLNELTLVTTLGLSNLYSANRDFEKAEEACKMLIYDVNFTEASPKQLDVLFNAYVNLGNIYTMMSIPDYSTALIYLNKADSMASIIYTNPKTMEQTRDMFVVYEKMATCLAMTNQPDLFDLYVHKADSTLQILVENNPQGFMTNKILFNHNLAFVYLNKFVDYSQCIHYELIAYRTLEQLKGLMSPIAYNYTQISIGGALALAYAKNKNEQEANLLMDSLFVVGQMLYELSPEQFTHSLVILFLQKAEICNYYNQYDIALQYAEQAITLEPTFPSCYDMKGEILFKQGHKQNALSQWRKVIELDPTYIEKNQSILYELLLEKGLITTE